MPAPSRDASVIGKGDAAIAQIAGSADKDADDIVADQVAVSESSDDDDDEDETAELMRCESSATSYFRTLSILVSKGGGR